MVTVIEMTVHPFHRVCVNIRRCHLNGSRQVYDELATIDADLKLICNGITYARRILKLGPRKRFRRVLIQNLGIRNHLLFVFLTQACTLQSNIQDTVFILTEYYAALQHRS